MNTEQGRSNQPRTSAQLVVRGARSFAIILSFALIIIAQIGFRAVRAQSTDGGAGPQKKEAAVEVKAAARPTPEIPSKPAPQKLIHEGVEVELTIDPILAKDAKPEALMEGQDAVVRFKITESRNGTPLTNLHPSAWMDLRAPGKLTENKDCVGSSRVDLQACKLEYSIVSPK